MSREHAYGGGHAREEMARANNAAADREWSADRARHADPPWFYQPSPHEIMGRALDEVLRLASEENSEWEEAAHKLGAAVKALVGDNGCHHASYERDAECVYCLAKEARGMYARMVERKAALRKIADEKRAEWKAAR